MPTFVYADRAGAERAAGSLRMSPPVITRGRFTPPQSADEPPAVVVRPVLLADGSIALVVPEHYAADLRERGDAIEERE